MTEIVSNAEKMSKESILYWIEQYREQLAEEIASAANYYNWKNYGMIAGCAERIEYCSNAISELQKIAAAK